MTEIEQLRAERDEAMAEQARLLRQMEAMKPFTCTAMSCKNRKMLKTCPHCGRMITE